VVALISSEHSKVIVWNDGSEEFSGHLDNDESDRLFTFEVAKTNEQEEDVTAQLGFTARSRSCQVNAVA
jgi:hypothetical protein